MLKLYFAVGAKEYLYMLLLSGVKQILVSYIYKEPLLCKKLLKRHNIELIVDSGAFSAWSRGNEIKIDEYLEFLNKYKDIIYKAVNLDVIRGGRRDPLSRQLEKEPLSFETKIKASKEDYEEAARQGFENYYYLKEKGWDTIHVFHQGEDFKWLDKMIKEIDYIGISPNNDEPSISKDAWLYECFAFIKNSSNPQIKTHGFAVTSPNLLAKYPYYSVDSAAWALQSAFGSITTPVGRVCISNQKENHPSHFGFLPLIQQKVIADYVQSLGFSIDMAKKKYKYRNLINIDFYLELEKRLNENPTILDDRQKSLFDLLNK